MVLAITMAFGMVGTMPDVKAASKTLNSSDIANYCNSQVGKSYASGYCLRFVADIFAQLGASRSSSCCAYNYGNTHIVSTSMDNIPVGADVFFGSCGGGPCKTCGARYFGHIGIWVGDGFVHATGGKVQKSSLKGSSWKNKYRGWGYHSNVTISDGGSGNPSGTSTQTEVKGFQSCVEKPAENSANSGDLLMEGWAIDGRGVSEVVAYLNGTPVCNCERFERTDVAKAFPGYPTGKEGFRCKISESALRAGENEIFFRAYTNSNTQVIADFGHRTVNHTPKKGLVFQIEDLPKDLVTEQIVGGWVLTDTPQKVIVVIEGKEYKTERFNRSDVKNVYKNYDASQAGFRLKIDPTMVKSGLNNLVIKAYISPNECQEIYKGEFHATKLPEQMFDAAFYYGMYSCSDSTVKKIGRNAGALYKDWCSRGLSHGYSPSIGFDPVHYLEVNPDVRRAYGNNNFVGAFTHYVNNVLDGREFRDCSPFLKLDFYRTSYSDLKHMYPAQLCYHFTEFGIFENRIASDSSQAAALHKMFDAETFANKNPDLLKVYGNGKANPKGLWQHYWYYTVANNEKRIINKTFDLGFLMDKYGFSNAAEAVNWYLETGYADGYAAEESKDTETKENVGGAIKQPIITAPVLPEAEEEPTENKDETGNKSPETEELSIEDNAEKEDESKEEIEELPIENRDETEEKFPETEETPGNETQTGRPANAGEQNTSEDLNDEEENETEKGDITSGDQEEFPVDEDKEEEGQEKGTCYIVFRSNRKIVKRQMVESGEKIKEPNITRRGYILLGWYSNGKRYCFEEKEIFSNLTLEAKWKRISVGKVRISLTKKGKKLRITYNKIAGAKGYEIEYSKNRKFKNSVKKKTVKLVYETTFLKRNGAYYYVRVRAYKTDSTGAKVFGKWSQKKIKM